MKKTAIILGATGLTGGLLLEELLKDDHFSIIKLFSRSTIGIEHQKIEEYIADLFELEKQTKNFKADVVFCCIGTTKANTPNKEKYRKIDYGIPVTAAQVAKKNRIPTFIVISALGVAPNSKVFYNRTKGEMERDVLKQEIENTYILQPSLIGGKRNERRVGELIAQFFMGVFGFLIPKKYKIIQPITIAKAMHTLSKKEYEEVRIPSHKIKEIAAK